MNTTTPPKTATPNKGKRTTKTAPPKTASPNNVKRIKLSNEKDVPTRVNSPDASSTASNCDQLKTITHWMKSEKTTKMKEEYEKGLTNQREILTIYGGTHMEQPTFSPMRKSARKKLSYIFREAQL